MPPWLPDAITVYFVSFVLAVFVALLCQASVVGGAAVIALLVTAAGMLRLR